MNRMKTSIFLILLMVLSSELFSQQKRAVLFLGNSYTYVNDLPFLTAQIALSKGDTLLYDSNTPGGYTFQAHATNSQSIAKIFQQNWDAVVL